jgi:hypothetical protein
MDGGEEEVELFSSNAVFFVVSFSVIFYKYLTLYIIALRQVILGLLGIHCFSTLRSNGRVV